VKWLFLAERSLLEIARHQQAGTLPPQNVAMASLEDVISKAVLDADILV